jgi:hypothetical protein
MPTVTGTLEAAATSETIQGTVEVMLCGYGSRVPRVNGKGMAARITSQDIPVATDGTFEFDAEANDEIAPDGTYYTVTVKDDNGDIAQVNAYRFTSDQPTYDLNLIDPYDPNQPPPPVPPLLMNLLDVVPFSAAPAFDASTYPSFRLTLQGDVDSSTITGQQPGNLYTFIIDQDDTGGHAFTWPPEFLNASPINQDPDSITIQTFIVDEDLTFYPIAGATYYP